MNDQINLMRYMWVIPQDVFMRDNVDSVAKILQMDFDCDTWVLREGRALALSPRGLLTNRQSVIDFAAFIAITKPIIQCLKNFIIIDDVIIHLNVPKADFYINLLLPYGEPEAKWCGRNNSYLKSETPFAFRAYSNYLLKSPSRMRIRTFLQKWIQKLSVDALYGETLDLGQTEYFEYSIPSTVVTNLQDGYEIHCSRHTLVTWPWLELYLAMREELPKKGRFWIDFFNPENKPHLADLDPRMARFRQMTEMDIGIRPRRFKPKIVRSD